MSDRVVVYNKQGQVLYAEISSVYHRKSGSLLYIITVARQVLDSNKVPRLLRMLKG